MDQWLPAGFIPKHSYGLISDTHMPMRLREWPETMRQVFAGVDAILHAGDVGELWVLDQLSEFAPIFAVHGNDDSPDSLAQLPNQLLLHARRNRILLWHGHYRDRIDEMASRVYQDMAPKLDRLVNRGLRAGANIVIMGHWHIPFVFEDKGVTVINPGALGSGNAVSRTTHRTVARLYISEEGEIAIFHIDLARPDVPHQPAFNPEHDFVQNLSHYSASIMSPELQPHGMRFFTELWPVARAAIHDIALKLAWEVWDGEKSQIELADWQREVTASCGLSEPERAQALAILATWNAK